MKTWEDYLDYVPEEKREKYSQSGIYCISIDDELVYIGKSKYMLMRLCSHLQSIDIDRKSNKYNVLRKACATGHKISFDVMEYCKEEDLDKREGVLIRAYMPPLNYQIPKEVRGWTANKRAKYITLEEILNPVEKWEKFDF